MRIKQDKILEKYQPLKVDGESSLINCDERLYRPKKCYENTFMLLLQTLEYNTDIRGVFGYVIDIEKKVAKRHCWLSQENKRTHKTELVDVTFFTEECDVTQIRNLRYIGLKEVTPIQWLSYFEKTKQTVMRNIDGERELIGDLKESGYSLMSDLDIYIDRGMYEGVEIKEEICYN